MRKLLVTILLTIALGVNLGRAYILYAGTEHLNAITLGDDEGRISMDMLGPNATFDGLQEDGKNKYRLRIKYGGGHRYAYEGPISRDHIYYDSRPETKQTVLSLDQNRLVVYVANSDKVSLTLLGGSDDLLEAHPDEMAIETRCLKILNRRADTEIALVISGLNALVLVLWLFAIRRKRD
jgi:hypothetical protein